VDSNVDLCAVDLLALDTLDVDNPLLAVDLGDLALLSLERATGNLDLQEIRTVESIPALRSCDSHN
jgi:hypothetical protein